MKLLIRQFSGLLHKVRTVNGSKLVQLTVVNYFHNNCNILYNNKKFTDNLPNQYPFHVADRKEKDTFLDIIHLYSKENKLRTGHSEFIIHALKYMDEFGLNKDLEVYKALLDVYPKGEYIATNRYQAMFYHYPKQQNTALILLDKMEYNRVIPDYEMQELILNIFGEQSFPALKLWRMTYWMPKFFKLNPWEVPSPLPKDPKEVAGYAIKKLSSKDVLTEVTEYQTKNVPDALDDTWILSAMSRSQQELLAVQPIDQALFVEGPFTVWFGACRLDYFVLKGNPIKREIIYDTADNVANIKIPFWEKLHNCIPVTVNEQDDGVYYAMCITGTSSKDSLLSWVRCMQETNNILNRIPIVFKLKSKPTDPLCIEDNKNSITTLDKENKNALKNN